MFSYYGTKKKIAKYYPNPKYGTIIEPFCGAAQYSLYGNNWKNEVILFDVYDTIVNIWKYLIQAERKDILDLPDFNEGDNLNDFKLLSNVEKQLIGFSINPGSAMPKKAVRARSVWNRHKLFIADNVYKIKHWSVELRDYRDIQINPNATWFIDPPYQFGGIYYRHSSKKINYFDLGDWCKSRNGQVIVCENTKSDWMDFNPLVELNGQLHKTTEAIWYKDS